MALLHLNDCYWQLLHYWLLQGGSSSKLLLSWVLESLGHQKVSELSVDVSARACVSVREWQRGDWSVVRQQRWVDQSLASFLTCI